MPELKPLPRETLAPATWRDVAHTLAGVLLLFALVDLAAVAGLERRPLNAGYRVIKEKWRLLERQVKPVDWLVLGDSAGNQGVMPSVLEANLGGTALNLCTIGAQSAMGDAWMLDAYLRQVGAPRHVLVVHVYDNWERELKMDGIAQVPLPWGFWERLDPPVRLAAGPVFELALHRYLPLYAQNQALSRLLRAPWSAFGRPFEMDLEGFVPEARSNPVAVTNDAQKHLALVRRGQAVLSLSNRRAIDAFQAMAEANGFDVWLAHAPVFSGLHAEEDYRRYFARVQEGLRSFTAQKPRVRLLASDPVTFPAEQMTNVDHVTTEGARRYTAMLASQIRSALGSAPEAAAASPP